MTEHSSVEGRANSRKQFNFPKPKSVTKDQQIDNPCYQESKMTLACMDKHNDSRAACSDEIKNYKNCRLFWTRVKNDRQRKGVRPFLPAVEDREKVIEDNLHFMPR